MPGSLSHDLDAAPAPASRGRIAALLGEPGSGRRRLAQSAAWNWAVFVANAAAVFVVSPIVVNALGDDGYGVWAIVIGLVGYMGFADLGVRPAVVYHVARHHAQGDLPGLNRMVASAFMAFAIGSGLILAATAAVAPRASAWFHLAAHLHDDAELAIWIVGLELAVTLPFNAYSAVLVGQQRFDLLGKVDLSLLVLRTAGILVAMHLGAGLVALALVLAGVGVLEIAAKAGLAFRVEPRLRFAPGLADRPGVGALLRYGGLAVVVSLATLLTWETDAFVIGLAIDAGAITHFVLPAQLAAYTRALLWAATRALAPASGALHALAEHDRLARMLGTAARTSLVLASPILVWLLVLGEPFLAAWLGERFRGESGEVLRILALGAAAPIASYPFVQALYGTNRMRLLASLSIAEGLANLAVSVALVGPLGIRGVAIGTAAPALVFHLGLVPWLAGRTLGISWAASTARTWTLPLAGGVLAWLLLGALVDPDEAYGLATLALFAVATAAGTLAIQGGLLLLPGLFRRRPAEPGLEEAAP